MGWDRSHWAIRAAKTERMNDGKSGDEPLQIQDRRQQMKDIRDYPPPTGTPVIPQNYQSPRPPLRYVPPVRRKKGMSSGAVVAITLGSCALFFTCFLGWGLTLMLGAPDPYTSSGQSKEYTLDTKPVVPADPKAEYEEKCNVYFFELMGRYPEAEVDWGSRQTGYFADGTFWILKSYSIPNEFGIRVNCEVLMYFDPEGNMTYGEIRGPGIFGEL
jgi:hypothetical protein